MLFSGWIIQKYMYTYSNIDNDTEWPCFMGYQKMSIALIVNLSNMIQTQGSICWYSIQGHAILYRYWRDGHEISRFGGLPRELDFPKGLYFAVHFGKILSRGKILSSVPVDICYIRWSKLMISSKFHVLYDYHEAW